MNVLPTRFRDWILGYASRLRFPYLLLVTAALFVTDLLLPDFLPFADEILLGLATLLLSRLRRRPAAEPRTSLPVGRPTQP